MGSCWQAENFAAKAQAQAAERVAELAALATSSAAAAAPPPGRPQPPSPAMHLVRAVADNLQRLFYGAIRRSYAYRLTEFGRRLSLQTGNLPSSLLKVRPELLIAKNNPMSIHPSQPVRDALTWLYELKMRI